RAARAPGRAPRRARPDRRTAVQGPDRPIAQVFHPAGRVFRHAEGHRAHRRRAQASPLAEGGEADRGHPVRTREARANPENHHLEGRAEGVPGAGGARGGVTGGGSGGGGGPAPPGTEGPWEGREACVLVFCKPSASPASGAPHRTGALPLRSATRAYADAQLTAYSIERQQVRAGRRGRASPRRVRRRTRPPPVGTSPSNVAAGSAPARQATAATLPARRSERPERDACRAAARRGPTPRRPSARPERS